MDEKFLKEFIGRIESLPALPAATRKLITMAEDADVEIPQITSVIATDPTLTAKILQVANSPFYGLVRKISNVSQALMLIGLRGIRNIAMSFSVMKFGQGKNNSLPINLEDFWRHSLAVGLASRELASLVSYPDPEEAFVAGLIHDIGKIVMMEYFPEFYGFAMKRMEKDKTPLYLAEYEVFEVGHSEVGAELCRHWNLPDVITYAVSAHHLEKFPVPEGHPFKLLAGIVKIANQLVKIARIGFSGDNIIPLHFLDAAHDLKFSSESFSDLIQRLPSMSKKVESFFDIKPSDLHNDPADNKNKAKIFIGLQNPREVEMMTLILTSLGYSVATEGNSLEDVLDFSSWRSKDNLDSFTYPMDKIADWLASQKIDNLKKIYTLS